MVHRQAGKKTAIHIKIKNVLKRGGESFLKNKGEEISDKKRKSKVKSIESKEQRKYLDVGKETRQFLRLKDLTAVTRGRQH